MTQKPDLRADIDAILQARRKASMEVQSFVPAPRRTELMPVQGRPGALQPRMLTQETLALTQPASLPMVQVASVPSVSDEDLSAFLEIYLPSLIVATENLARPPFAWNEVVMLGQLVSQAVATGLPQIKGKQLEAQVLVVVLARHLWRKYATPLLPSHVRPMASLLETLVIASIEVAYQVAVKRRQ